MRYAQTARRASSCGCGSESVARSCCGASTSASQSERLGYRRDDLASRKVGLRGKVIGVDMTPEMIDRARSAAAKGSYANTEFTLTLQKSEGHEACLSGSR
jgi:hypothetical protein